MVNPAIVVAPSTGSIFAPGALSDTITSASATVSVADLTEIVFDTVGAFIDGEVINDNRTQVLTLASVTGFSVGDTVTAGAAVGTIALVVGLTITVIVGTGSFSPGPITDSTSFAVSLITTVAPSTATITGISPDIITVTTLPADETTDLEEFHQAVSIATRSHAQLVFQGRLSSNQTKIRFIKLTIRGLGASPMVQVNVFVSGFGPNNHYTGSFSTFQTMPLSDLEIEINENNLMNQPSAAGKLYSIVVEFNLADGDSGVVSTPFFRHE